MKNISKQYIERIAAYIDLGMNAAVIARKDFAEGRINRETFNAATDIIVASYKA